MVHQLFRYAIAKRTYSMSIGREVDIAAGCRSSTALRSKITLYVSISLLGLTA